MTKKKNLLLSWALFYRIISALIVFCPQNQWDYYTFFPINGTITGYGIHIVYFKTIWLSLSINCLTHPCSNEIGISRQLSKSSLETEVAV